ncbi:hypothetical protein Pve01_31150 [Planomonospora venezuelensis]|nr:hypothetical protein Pve01_31150 [Planomonospora venezuelensis]
MAGTAPAAGEQDGGQDSQRDGQNGRYDDISPYVPGLPHAPIMPVRTLGPADDLGYEKVTSEQGSPRRVMNRIARVRSRCRPPRYRRDPENRSSSMARPDLRLRRVEAFPTPS